MSITVIDILQSIRPGAQWSCVGSEYTGINWLDEDQTKPTEQEYNAAKVALEAQAPLDATKAKAKALIAATDWSVLTDVGLANVSEFIAYRAILRELIKNPVVDPEWPTEPTPVWS